MIYRLTYDLNGTPYSARFEADDLDMAIAQMKLEDPVVSAHGKLAAVTKSVDEWGYEFKPVPFCPQEIAAAA